jgi:hypothetical protein
MPVRAMIGRGGVGVALFMAALAVSAWAKAQVYRSGQACWEETPCPSFGGEAQARKAAPRRPEPRAQLRRPTPAPVGERHARPQASPPAPAAGKSSQRLYRYPSIYQAEAPPLLPPGAGSYPPYAQQPYVLVSQGVWYWPGANDFKMPQVAGFEPAIDPGRVISW